MIDIDNRRRKGSSNLVTAKTEDKIPQQPAPGSRSIRDHGRAAKKPYRKPRLIAFGDVRDLTFGASPGIGDSANPGLLQP